MHGSPVPIYLGCAGLIVGSLGLGAQHLLGGDSSATNAGSQPPLFARSVEQASLPTERWSSQNRDVAYYGPMVELLTQPTSSTPAPAMEPSPTAAVTQQEQQSAAAPRDIPNTRSQPPVREVAPAPAPPTTGSVQTTERAQEEPRAVPREVVRDLPREQTRQSKRTRNARTRDDVTAPTEQADPRDSERRDPAPRRAERRYRDREDSEPVETRSRADRPRPELEERRQREGERRVVIREETREPEQRVVRGPEQGFGFSPFRLFGIFDQR